jgi:hypothetical protein
MPVDAKGKYQNSQDRPPAPWRRSEAVINLDWHHTIPCAMMRNVWRALAENQELAKCQVALQSYLRLLRVDNPKAWVKQMESGTLSFPQQEELDHKLAWPSWNIVEGPKYRVDDPKNDTTLDEFTSGLTISEWNRQQRIKDLFTGFQIFNAATSGGKLNEDTAMAVAVVMNTGERTLLAGDVIRFRPAMWAEATPPQATFSALAGLKWWKKKSGFRFSERS